MKNILAVVGPLLALAAAPARACSCLGVTAPAGQWVKRVAGASAYIFVGTVRATPVVFPGQPVSLHITHHIKGRFTGTPVFDACPSFQLAKGEERVFFVSRAGTIDGCSDYTYYLTNFGVLKELSRVLSPGA